MKAQLTKVEGGSFYEIEFIGKYGDLTINEDADWFRFKFDGKLEGMLLTAQIESFEKQKNKMLIRIPHRGLFIFEPI